MRLTSRDEYGNADIIGVDSADLQLNLKHPEFNRVTNALNKLAQYEETEMALEAEVERLKLMVKSITEGLDEAIEANQFLEKYLYQICEVHYTKVTELQAEVERLRKKYEEVCVLTLEELRALDGEPVYLQFGDGCQAWAIAECDTAGKWFTFYGVDFENENPDEDFYNMEYKDPAGHYGLHVLGWRAYKNKPL